jgi:hypothetical protein
MKKILYLFLTVALIGCSSNDNIVEDSEDSDITPQPTTITFTVREVWKSKLTWDKTNTIFSYNREMCSLEENTLAPISQSDLTGFETVASNHFSIDTLVIDINTHPWQPDAKFFDFKISSRFDLKSEPKRIGHLEFIGFNSESRLILEQALMDYEIINGERYAQIDYFSSNLSEEFIESITYDGQNNNYYICEPKKIFHKKDYGSNYYEPTILRITVPQDEDNLNLEIGDKIGRLSYSNKPLGDGWDARFNNSYLILDKE